MPATDLTLIRSHLVLDHQDDDALLNHYASVAETWVSAYIGAPFDAGNHLMVQAVLLMVAHQHQSREAIVYGSAYLLPLGVADLLSPLKTRITGHVPEPEVAAE